MTATFDLKTANQEDVVLTIIGGETLTSIKNGTTPLTLTTHYTVATNKITIKKAYLATLTTDTTATLTIKYPKTTVDVKISVFTTA